jgi:hypothetical protein
MRALGVIREAAAEAPDRAQFFAHIAVPLNAKSAEAAESELLHLLKGAGPGVTWFYATQFDKDNRFSGLATDLLKLRRPITDDKIGQVLLFDIHSRIGAWWLTNLWRSAELAEDSCRSLAEWSIISAAATARSLLEGAVAVAIEGEALLHCWDQLKRGGKPRLDQTRSFRSEFDDRLLRAQFGTRIGESEGKRRIKSTNVLTQIQKLAKHQPHLNLSNTYEWLADAAHPSAGSGLVYLSAVARHRSGTILAGEISRRNLIVKSSLRDQVAFAVTNAVVISARLLLVHLRRIQWLIDDLGFTSGVAFLSRVPDQIGTCNEPQRNHPCPCGSGRRYKDCSHRWGVSGETPKSLSDLDEPTLSELIADLELSS